MKIDWAYLRKGWVSCTKAQDVFTTQNISITETADARKEKIEGEQAWQILQKASDILIAKGKKIVQFSPSSTDKEAILASALGRSGTLRAPTLKIGGTFLIGFNEELYANNIK